MGFSHTQPLLAPREDEEKSAKDLLDSHVENGLPGSETEALLKRESDAKHGENTFWQATMNCVNLLLGMGLLALPSCLEEGGWLSLGMLYAFAVTCCFTGILLSRCLSNSSLINTYQDIGQAAFGSHGRLLVTVFLFLEVAAYLVGITIAMGDNLGRLFPETELHLPWLDINLHSSQVYVIVAVMVALPTTWLRDMNSLSFVSVGGVVSSLVVMGAVAWAGIFGGVGFSHRPPLLNIRNFPLVSGIYAYAYAGHILLPSIYKGMANPAQFPQVLMVSSALASVIYGGTAVMGATMFGEDTQSQITLNIPRHLAVATIALWTTVITPLSKFALGLAPVAEQLERLLPFPRDSKTHFALGTTIRTMLLFLVLAIALAAPFFQNILALCGASVGLTMAVTLPAAFYLKIFRASLSITEIVPCVVCVIVGVVASVVGTENTLRALIDKIIH